MKSHPVGIIDRRESGKRIAFGVTVKGKPIDNGRAIQQSNGVKWVAPR